MNRHIFVPAVALLSLGIGACSSSTRESIATDVNNAVTAAQGAAAGAVNDAAEAAVRNIATQQGEEQFTNAGHALNSDGLTCEAKVSNDAAHVDVSCTGTTGDGQPAELTGQTSELPGASVTELEGSFSGKVAGAEVFNTTHLGG